MSIRKLARAACAAAACFVVLSGARAHADAAIPGAVDRVLVLVNQARAQAGLGALTLDPNLNQSAQNYSDYMATANFYAHDGPDGSTPLSRMNAAGFPGTGTWGENIAAYYSDADSVMTAWMNSPGHRANILNPSFTQIGIGVAYGPNSQWKYYWTQDFGIRAGGSAGSSLGSGGTSLSSTGNTGNSLGSTGSGQGSAAGTPLGSLPQTQPQQVAQPVLSQLSPSQGAPGSTVTLVGQSFGSVPGTVSFSGTSATVLYWSDTQIQARVPAGASSGAVYVQNSQGMSNGVNFTVVTTAASAPTTATPQALFIYPSSGSAGARVTIYGRGFGTSAGQVLFNGVPGQVAYWYDTLVGVTVPAGASSGPVVVQANGGASNGLSFTVNGSVSVTQPQQPTYPSLGGGTTNGSTPTTGGTTTLRYRPWWETSGTGTPQPAPQPTTSTSPLGSTNTETGSGASLGQGIALQPSNGPPNLMTIAPAIAAPGSTITIQGSNFGSSRGWVWIGRMGAQIVSWSDTTIVAVVPSNFAPEGRVSVRVVRSDYRFSMALYLELGG